MKKIIFITVILTVIAISGASAQNNGSVTVKNETGYTLNYLYFSPSGFDDWGDDFLGGNNLDDGKSVEIQLQRDIDNGEEIYDLQAIDEDNDYYTIYEVDIANSRYVTVTMENYDGGNDDDDDYSYSGYDDGYNAGYTEGYQEGYKDAFRDAYLEGFRAATEMDNPAAGTGSSSRGWQ